MDSIELLLDDRSEAFISAEWDALQAAGLPSRAAHRSPHNRPHITVIAAPAISGDHDQKTGADLELPVQFRSSGIVLFNAGRRGYVLARQVIGSAELLRLHRTIYDAGAVIGATPTSAPGAWVPHVTLANAVAPDHLAQALTILATPMPEGQVIGVRRWDSLTKTISIVR